MFFKNTFQRLMKVSNFKFNSSSRVLHEKHVQSTVVYKPINLSFSEFHPKDPFASCAPIIILHGLLGSKQNWKSLGKIIAIKTNRKVYVLDARNHGDSPHCQKHDYSEMALDVKHFIETKNQSSVILVGHSMGGRTAMMLALTEPKLVKKLVVVDVSPKSMPSVTSDTPKYIKSMKEAISSIPSTMGVTKARQIIDEYLSKTVREKDVRLFLLTNLTEIDGIVKWKPNLEVLLEKFSSGIMNFPSVSSCFPQETLFICGGNSPYVRTEDYPDIKKIFPKSEFVIIPEAGHWVHSERPSDFIEALYNFIA